MTLLGIVRNMGHHSKASMTQIGMVHQVASTLTIRLASKKPTHTMLARAALIEASRSKATKTGKSLKSTHGLNGIRMCMALNLTRKTKRQMTDKVMV